MPENTIGKTPIPKREYHDIIDSSKLQTFVDCPRKYFYNHILGWQPKQTSVHLFFGSAWHEAMEHLMNHGYEIEEVQRAYDKFMAVWNEEKPDDELWTPHRAKNPSRAMEALVDYAEKYKRQDRFETMYTEVAGTVPVMEDQLLHFKVDAIIKDKDGWIKSLEHKTTGRNSKSWRNKWAYKIQTGTYHHALNTIFGQENVKGIVINGAVLRTNDHEFLRLPVTRSKDNMMMWLWEVQHWIRQLRWNMEQLAECSEDDQVMVAFPRNSESCSKFGCSYPGLCSHWPNPLRRCGDGTEPPMSYEQDFWDPRRNEEEATNVAHLDESNEIKQNKDEQSAEEGSSEEASSQPDEPRDSNRPERRESEDNSHRSGSSSGDDSPSLLDLDPGS